ncbi:hypothetical protein AFV9_gp09 [Betalipothrixvirus uzonense]|uniref:Uncharacterized protein n=1 Tax=Betalipothrixvirus uzonense TaxID=512792 RepID=B2CRI6_9VIRU|nr:hypothetical protein AFV9_gp09 [Acidianus filamentous virus 9]ACB37243.1 hypothetical protein [Acidianus filamentous virus 9]
MTIKKYYEIDNEIINAIFIIKVKTKNVKLSRTEYFTINDENDLKKLEEVEKEVKELEKRLEKEAEEMENIIAKLEEKGFKNIKGEKK